MVLSHPTASFWKNISSHYQVAVSIFICFNRASKWILIRKNVEGVAEMVAVKVAIPAPGSIRVRKMVVTCVRSFQEYSVGEKRITKNV